MTRPAQFLFLLALIAAPALTQTFSVLYTFTGGADGATPMRASSLTPRATFTAPRKAAASTAVEWSLDWTLRARKRCSTASIAKTKGGLPQRE